MMDKEKITGQNENNEHEEKIPLLKKLPSGQSICRKISETYIYIDGGIHDKENEDKNDEEKTSFSEKLSSGSKACRKLAETIINLNRGTNEEQKTDHEDKKENENLLETLTSGSKMCRKIAERLIHEGKEAEEKIPILKTLSSGRKMYTKLAEKFINADSDEQNEEEITEQDENEGDMPLLNILSNSEEACKKLAEKYLHVELPHIPINFHSYQQKKNWAHGMMNLALLSSHVGHVKSLLQQSFEDRSGLFYTNFMVTLISIFMQVMVSIGLVWNGRYDLNKPGHHHKKAHLLNNCTFSGTLVITVMNVILSALGVPTIPTNMPILIGNLTNIADVFNKIS